MRPRPGVECRETEERRWRDVVDPLRKACGGLYIEVDMICEDIYQVDTPGKIIVM